MPTNCQHADLQHRSQPASHSYTNRSDKVYLKTQAPNSLKNCLTLLILIILQIAVTGLCYTSFLQTRAGGLFERMFGCIQVLAACTQALAEVSFKFSVDMLMLSDSNAEDYHSNSWDQKPHMLESLHLKAQLPVETSRNKWSAGANLAHSILFMPGLLKHQV